MAAVNDPEKCCYCAGCPIVCPAQAIELLETRITIDREECTSCGNCVRVCPAGAMSLEK
jgi:Fe-S-cluster-containing hydrogenase component 2